MCCFGAVKVMSKIVQVSYQWVGGLLVLRGVRTGQSIFKKKKKFNAELASRSSHPDGRPNSYDTFRAP